jgi:hypothetical protein
MCLFLLFYTDVCPKWTRLRDNGSEGKCSPLLFTLLSVYEASSILVQILIQLHAWEFRLRKKFYFRPGQLWKRWNFNAVAWEFWPSRAVWIRLNVLLNEFDKGSDWWEDWPCACCFNFPGQLWNGSNFNTVRCMHQSFGCGEISFQAWSTLKTLKF